MNAAKRLSLIVVCWLGAAGAAAAQDAPFRHELLSLLPDDFAVCIVMRDLRGHAARWEQSDWLKAFRQSSVGRTLLDSPEFAQLTRVRQDLKKHFDLDWPEIRDDLLGDTLLLAHIPGPKNRADDERGLFVIHTSKPERVAHFIDKLNAIQRKTGELKALTELKHKGRSYFRREDAKKTHYYFLSGSLAALSTGEEILHAVLERQGAVTRDNAWAKRFEQAGAASAFVTLCVNPRNLQPDFVRQGKKDDAMPAYWRALDAIFVTFAIRAEAELRVSIQADPRRLPDWAKAAFTETLPASTLWRHFPQKSVLTVASRSNFAAAADALKWLLPEKDRNKLTADWKGGVGALLGLDPFEDILPNIGPDWGLCVLPARNDREVPRLLFALAVQPGEKKPPVDRAIYQGAQFLAGLALLDHNKNHPNSIIRLETAMQDQVEVKYLANDSLFPKGFQPAFALKDGFFVLATAPDAIADFRVQAGQAKSPKDSPLLRLSTPELAKVLEQRRAQVVAGLVDRQKMAEKNARQNLDDVIALLGLFEHLTLSHHGGNGQASWIVRLTPAQSSTKNTKSTKAENRN